MPVRLGASGNLEIESQGFEPRIDGRTQLALVTLDVLEGILEGIEELNKKIAAEQPQGQVRDYDFSVSNKDILEIHDPNQAWIGISVHNPRLSDSGETDSTLFVYINARNHANPVKIKPGEIAHMDFKTPVIRKVYVSCNEAGNTCSGHIVAKY